MHEPPHAIGVPCRIVGLRAARALMGIRLRPQKKGRRVDAPNCLPQLLCHAPQGRDEGRTLGPRGKFRPPEAQRESAPGSLTDGMATPRTSRMFAMTARAAASSARPGICTRCTSPTATTSAG